MSTRGEAQDTTARNQAVFRRVIEGGFTEGNLAVIDELISPDCAEHQSGLGPGPEGVKSAISYLHSVFPDFSLTVEDMTADGDKVWARLRSRGTQRGPHMGMPPTGRRFEVAVIDICRFEAGKIVEHWGVPDRFAILEQLGLLPTPQPPVAKTG